MLSETPVAGGTELRQGKVWGETTEFLRTTTMSAHHLTINKDSQCSEHRHQHKSNLFYVIIGLLEVTIYREEQAIYPLIDVTIVKPGQTTCVSPGIFHKFKALENTEAIEIYQVELLEPDIERRTGGR
jgi:mannose-6-phosphate isomerase-like protein (cupin superfamily)